MKPYATYNSNHKNDFLGSPKKLVTENILKELIFLVRFKIAGPDGTNYWAAHDSEVNGSSDAEEEEA